MQQKTEAATSSALTSYKPISYSIAAATSTTAAASLPGIHALVTAPTVSWTVRNGLAYALSGPGQTLLQRAATQYMAEAAAVNLVAQGYAPYVLGAAAGGTVLTVLTAYSCATTAYRIGRWAYNRHCAANQPEMLAIEFHSAAPNQAQAEADYVIARAKLEAIINDYQTQSPARACLSFFRAMNAQSAEIAQISQYLADNPNLQYISLKQLADTTRLIGQALRVQALENHQRIEAPQGSGTNATINQIIDSSVNAKLITALDTLGIALANDGQMPTQQEINQAYRAAALATHPDRPTGSEAAFKAVAEAKEQAEKLLGYADNNAQPAAAAAR